LRHIGDHGLCGRQQIVGDGVLPHDEKPGIAEPAANETEQHDRHRETAGDIGAAVRLLVAANRHRRDPACLPVAQTHRSRVGPRQRKTGAGQVLAPPVGGHPAGEGPRLMIPACRRPSAPLRKQKRVAARAGKRE